ncbi:hypothetical protein [uncultured Prevotella sp.]|uniref:hypothetical protein n=1 Tax=uncultured Prevotella sp. TaxID=159272 RepID=UPI0027E292AE|nr:hypothetical protein [uncultured Prevotella sp.]
MKKIYSIFAMAAMCAAVYAQSNDAPRQFAESQKPTAKFSLNNLPKLSELKKANHLQKRAAQKKNWYSYCKDSYLRSACR